MITRARTRGRRGSRRPTRSRRGCARPGACIGSGSGGGAGPAGGAADAPPDEAVFAALERVPVGASTICRPSRDRPAVRAPDLAESFGRETAAFKRDIRQAEGARADRVAGRGLPVVAAGRVGLACAWLRARSGYSQHRGRGSGVSAPRGANIVGSGSAWHGRVGVPLSVKLRAPEIARSGCGCFVPLHVRSIRLDHDRASNKGGEEQTSPRSERLFLTPRQRVFVSARSAGGRRTSVAPHEMSVARNSTESGKPSRPCHAELGADVRAARAKRRSLPPR